MDAISSWWVNLFGHAHPLINRRIATQLNQLEHVILAGCIHQPIAELSERLVEIAPSGLNWCFYADNGSSAVEAALKMSYHSWRNRGYASKHRFITLGNSYHGETLGALAIGDVSLYKDIYRPLLMEAITVVSPDCYPRTDGASWEEHSRQMFCHMEQALSQYHDQVCAVIVEPLVQCAGNMRMYHPVYLELLRQACDRYHVHLIADEIAVGFGRTGTLFACEQANIAPDLLCLSKGLTAGYLPLSVVMTTDPIYEAFYDDDPYQKAFLHSHSYTGNPLACSAALACLELFETTDVIQRNRALSTCLQQNLETLSAHPNVAEVRQHGMIAAVELVQDKVSRAPFQSEQRLGRHLGQFVLDRGVLLRPLGDVVYFMPPYVIEEHQIATMVEVAAEGIDHVYGR